MTNCEDCVYYEYDPEADTNYCEADLDEDEMERFLRSANDSCPFYRDRTGKAGTVAPLSRWPKLMGKPSRSGGDAGMKWDRPAYLILSKRSLDGRRKVWYPDMRKRKRLAPSGCCAVCHPG